ncbi:hypothetical protein OLMES_1679 [Oleiphilus messinensis]|uniref:DUF1415 domain-containing protein n=1 Tax=Oleiphilus messinensis TaxID=141451 RepID=A0A1Y0I8J0_9GAMM|nr:DUF1415 domain-containing protein [Oleiphilus messinensis]ARU55754.1 hypothetical protein OLMES_1679 [Oleiphilus messinensis]
MSVKAIQATQQWVNDVIVKYNFCPFARPVLNENRVRFSVITEDRIQDCLTHLLKECQLLDDQPEVETTLIILENGFNGFDDYLELLSLSEALLIDQDYEGIYQLASFHPEYQFAGAPQDDPANYTNRSPFPVLHLLREESLEVALRDVDNPEKIPERNIRVARELGTTVLKKALQDCQENQDAQ